MKTEIHNWRWRGVPFYLRTGKRLPRKITQVAVIFRPAPIQVFAPSTLVASNPTNSLITLQPSEGFALGFSVKTPGRPFSFTNRALQFDYKQAFGGELPEAYETLLRDVMIGDQTLFVTANFTETAWRLYDPLISGQRDPCSIRRGRGGRLKQTNCSSGTGIAGNWDGDRWSRNLPSFHRHEYSSADGSFALVALALAGRDGARASPGCSMDLKSPSSPRLGPSSPIRRRWRSRNPKSG